MINVRNVARARVYNENTTFATDHTGTLADFKDLPFVEGTMQLQLIEPLEAPGYAQQLIDGWPIKVHMPKRARASFDINLAGLGLTASLRTQSALGTLLYVVFGGEQLGTGSTINDAGATTTSFIVTSASGILKGSAVALATGTGGRLEMREVKNVSGTTVTLKHALSSAPSNGSTIYSCATYYPSTELASGYGYSLQMIVEGQETDDRWLLLGGQVASPPRFTVSNGAIARMTFEFEFANWFYADGSNTAGNLTSSALAAATYSSTVPVVVKDSELRFYDAGTTSISNTLIDATSYEFNTSIAYGAHLAPGGTQNIVGWVRRRTAPLVSGSFTAPYESQTWWTEKSQDDVRAFSLQIGSSATASTGGGVLLTAPAVQVTDIQLVDVDGIQCQQVSWEGTNDSDITSPSGDRNYAAMRIHLF